MERFFSTFTALSAGAFLLAYPGIFSRLSNDGKQSPALIYTMFQAYCRTARLFVLGGIKKQGLYLKSTTA